MDISCINSSYIATNASSISNGSGWQKIESLTQGDSQVYPYLRSRILVAFLCLATKDMCTMIAEAEKDEERPN